MSQQKLDAVIAAINAEIKRSCPRSTFPPISPAFWLSLESPTDIQMQELSRTGRHTLAVLNFHFTKGRGITQRAYQTIQQCVLTRRTYCELKHMDFPGSPQSTTISVQVFLLWVAGLHDSLEPARLIDWFHGVFGPLIESAEQIIREQLKDTDDTDSDDSDAEQPPNKKLRLDSDGKYATACEILRTLRSLEPQAASAGPSRRSPSSTSTSNGDTKRGAVRQATASILQKASPPSCPAFAPVLNPKPAAMPGAWPPTPPRPFKRTRNSTFSRFASTISHHRPPTHFCPVIETALKNPRQGSPLNTI
ncbi:hypothetical protein K438DRAFT_1998296 [Mycena galopus ATCC 62051]|nr:hypothetical protein K438DRAFT_1998296 [Mycena galopus ATCC 62051]